LSNFLKCFWSTTCKLGTKGGKRIICLKLIMAMDAIIGIGTSCCTLSPSKWLCHVDSLNIAFIANHVTIFPLYTHKFLPGCIFQSKPFNNSMQHTWGSLSYLQEETTKAWTPFEMCMCIVYNLWAMRIKSIHSNI
jgi:hypothetical protein